MFYAVFSATFIYQNIVRLSGNAEIAKVAFTPTVFFANNSNLIAITINF